MIDEIKSYGYTKLEYNNFSEGIISTVDQLVQKAKIKLSDLKGIFVIQGPGSFTGLRVGITVANQFSHQLDIPIIGIKMEEFYKHRTDEKDFFYIQTMNKSEVYVIGFGKYEKQFDEKIISIDEFVEHATSLSRILGELKYDHVEKLSEQFEEIKNFQSIEDTWLSIVGNTKLESGKKYDLIQPYYGKNPNITKSNKRFKV